ncbi:hypothetical protein MP638_005205 [Amoeboaphelidium occidentale]|nr:hypothetical protein MP638_005205 [Amoeboaphelidium occidentale]
MRFYISTTYILIWWWVLVSLSWCSDENEENAYPEDKAFEVLRRVIHHQHQAGTFNEDFKPLTAVSNSVRMEIPLNSPLGWKYHRQTIREVCPAAFREKVFRELFHERIAYSSRDNPSTDSSYMKRDIRRYFGGMLFSQFDHCLQMITRYCQLEGTANNKQGSLSLVSESSESTKIILRKSVKGLISACPVRLQIVYGDLRLLAHENEILTLLKSIELVFDRNPLLGTVRLPKVTDLSLFFIDDRITFDMKQMLDYTFDATKMETIHISFLESYCDRTSHVASIAQFIQKCKKLSSLNVLSHYCVHVDAIINSAPTTINHFTISGILMKPSTVGSLDNFFERAIQLQSLRLDYTDSTSGHFPKLPRSLKSLALLPSNSEMHGSIPLQLQEMNALEKLMSSVSFKFKEFYLNITESVEEIHLFKIRFTDDEELLNFLRRFQGITFEKLGYEHVDKALKVVLNSDNIRSVALRSCYVFNDVFPINGASRIENLSIDNYIGNDDRITRFASNVAKAFKRMPNLNAFSFQSHDEYLVFAPIHEIMRMLARVPSLVYVDIFVNEWKYSKMDRMMKNTFDKSLTKLWNERKDLIIIGR